MQRCTVFAVAVIVALSGCGRKTRIRKVELLDEKLTFTLAVSPDREDPSHINGKLKIVNSSIDMVKYGNFQLFLEIDGNRARTQVKAEKGNAMADERLLHLSPGDTLHFFALWVFREAPDFQDGALRLVYDPSITAPREQTP